jgi:hypothetical protein
MDEHDQPNIILGIALFFERLSERISCSMEGIWKVRQALSIRASSLIFPGFFLSLHIADGRLHCNAYLDKSSYVIEI